jgi:hypothetical protein
MPKSRPEKNNPKKDEAKILYGKNQSVCFACGSQIESNSEICPYCKTIIE